MFDLSRLPLVGHLFQKKEAQPEAALTESVQSEATLDPETLRIRREEGLTRDNELFERISDTSSTMTLSEVVAQTEDLFNPLHGAALIGCFLEARGYDIPHTEFIHAMQVFNRSRCQKTATEMIRSMRQDKEFAGSSVQDLFESLSKVGRFAHPFTVVQNYLEKYPHPLDSTDYVSVVGVLKAKELRDKILVSASIGDECLIRNGQDARIFLNFIHSDYLRGEFAGKILATLSESLTHEERLEILDFNHGEISRSDDARTILNAARFKDVPEALALIERIESKHRKDEALTALLKGELGYEVQKIGEVLSIGDAYQSSHERYRAISEWVAQFGKDAVTNLYEVQFLSQYGDTPRHREILHVALLRTCAGKFSFEEVKSFLENLEEPISIVSQISFLNSVPVAWPADEVATYRERLEEILRGELEKSIPVTAAA